MQQTEKEKHFEIGRSQLARKVNLPIFLNEILFIAPFINFTCLLLVILYPISVWLLFPICFIWTATFLVKFLISKPLLTKPPKKGSLLKSVLPLPIYLGMSLHEKKPLWADPKILLTHMMVLGTTGSGKTQFLLGLLHQSLLQGSGFIFVDGKGDIENWQGVYGIAKAVGLEDNLLLLNLSVNNHLANKNKVSNTWNPFARGGSDELMELISGFLGTNQSEGGMWKGRATVLGRIVLRALCELRDIYHQKIILSDFADSLELSALEKMMTDRRFSELTRKLIQRYLHSLPSWKISKTSANTQEREKAAQVANEQHGYLTMQYTNLLDILIGTYRHITGESQAEIDFKDVIQNKRMLYVILPSLEKSPDTLKILGQIVVSSIKIAISESLGAKDPNAAPREKSGLTQKTVFPIVCDEYGYYAVEGFANLPAQIRSSQMSMIFSAQDFDSFKKGSEIEAGAILQNTTTKVFMKSLPGATTDLAVKYSGEAYIFMADSLKGRPGVFNMQHAYSEKSGLHKVTRLTQDDLVKLRVGEAYIFYEDRRWLVSTYYGKFEKPALCKINEFFPLPAFGDKIC